MVWQPQPVTLKSQKRGNMFKKTDGTIKQYYIVPCEYILSAHKRYYEISIGRRNDIIDEYWAYEVKVDCHKKKNRDNITKKICEICNYYNLQTRIWYYYGQHCIEMRISDDDFKDFTYKIHKLLEVTKDR